MTKILRTSAAVIGLAIAGGCAAGDKPSSAANPIVFTRIAAMSDCGELQDEFDIADRNGEAARNRGRLDLARASTDYMKAAHNRMEEVGCY